MNVRDQTRQTFVTSLRPFRYRTSKFVHRPKNIRSTNQHVPNIDIPEHVVSKLWTFLQLIHFLLLLQIDDHPCMALRLCMVAQLFYSQVRNIFLCISLHDLPHRRTMMISFRHQVSPRLLFLTIFLWLQWKSLIQTWFCNCCGGEHVVLGTWLLSGSAHGCCLLTSRKVKSRRKCWKLKMMKTWALELTWALSLEPWALSLEPQCVHKESPTDQGNNGVLVRVHMLQVCVHVKHVVVLVLFTCMWIPCNSL